MTAALERLLAIEVTANQARRLARRLRFASLPTPPPTRTSTTTPRPPPTPGSFGALPYRELALPRTAVDDQESIMASMINQRAG